MTTSCVYFAGAKGTSITPDFKGEHCAAVSAAQEGTFCITAADFAFDDVDLLIDLAGIERLLIAIILIICRVA